MPLPTFDTLTNFFLGSAAGAVNNNFTKTRAYLDELINRDGSQEMQANLDMNSNRLINLGEATSPSQAVTLGQIQTLISGDIDLVYLVTDEGLWQIDGNFDNTEGFWDV